MGEEDGLFGCQSWEEAESFLQKEAVSMAIQKAGIEKWQLRMIYAGDLLAQTIASSFGIMGFHTPVYGLYGACSTMGEGLSLASMAVAGGYAEYVAAVTSSHFASAKKNFAFPWAMETKDRFLLPGQLREAEPVFWEERAERRELQGLPQEKSWISD